MGIDFEGGDLIKGVMLNCYSHSHSYYSNCGGNRVCSDTFGIKIDS